ncbi:MAG: hypothetical protein JSR85_09160 [Proteobacteria bacterium]|nr:hypothetical protein [Pseudomonadota bacterium]
MTMIDAIRDSFDDYVRELPKNISKAAFESGVYSFAASVLFSGGDIHIGLATAALAAIVSVISGLTMPFFRESFADHLGFIKWYHQAVGFVINLAIAQVAINFLTPYRVDLLAGSFFTIGLNLMVHGLRDRSTFVSSTYIMV